MKQIASSSRPWFLAVVLTGLSAALLYAVVANNEDIYDLFNYDLYNAILAAQVHSVADIVGDYECEQLDSLPISPPDPSIVLTMDGGLLAFSPGEFPSDFVQGLLPIEQGAVTLYPITVYEDAGRRIRVILNAKGEALATLPAPGDYDPQWYAKEVHPDLTTMDRDEAAWLVALYDPSRIVVTYNLIPVDDLTRYVWERSLEVAAQKEQEGAGGGAMMRGWEGGSVTNIKIVSVDVTNNASVDMTIVYPNNFTNRLDILVADGGRALIDSWWDVGLTTNVSLSTNWIAWTDPATTNRSPASRFYRVYNADIDTDGDGFSDGREIYVFHTNPSNSASKPVSVSGTISYTGTVSGPIRMIAVTSSNSWIGCMATIQAPGSYTNSKVAVSNSYWFKGYRDWNFSNSKEFGEPWGLYSSTATLVTNNRTGINITLSDRDEDADGLIDWWELMYFGDSSQNGSGDPDGDGLVNSNEFTYGTNPSSADTDNDELTVYSTNPTNSDSDCDGMGDGTEVDNGQSPSVSNTYFRLPFMEGFETNTVHTGSISNQNGWIAWPTNKAVVVTDLVHGGQQALALQQSFDSVTAYHMLGTHGLPVIWIDAWMRFDTSNSVRYCALPDLSDAPAWQACFFSVNDRGQLVAYSGDSTNSAWITSTNVTIHSDFHRYSIRQDFAAKIWDLYLDGTNIFAGLGFRDAGIVEFSRFSLSGSWGQSLRLDDLTIGTNQPSGVGL